jgi:4-hydroxybenzoate polyprenyltransferase
MMKQRKSLVLSLALATHLPQALAMICLATLGSWAYGQRGLGLLWVVLAVTCGQASVGWVNDLKDSKIDTKFQRKHKPLVGRSLTPNQIKLPIAIALTLTIPFSFLAAGWLGGLAHIIAVLSAQVYNLYLVRTNWSWLPYAVSFSLLPVFIAQSSSTAVFPSWQIVVISICVGVIAHIFNALPDIDLDKRSNLGGAIVALGKARAITSAAVLSAVILALLAQLSVS